MLSIEETRALADPAPEMAEILESNPPHVGGWTKETNIVQVRGLMAQMQEANLAASPDPSTLPFIEEDIQITVRDGADINVRLHKPRNIPADGCPVLVAFHGGGFLIGGVEAATHIGRLFTSVGGIAVNVAYRLAPEHPFPVPVNDSFDAVKWTVENARDIGVNLDKGFIIGGESAGADLALGVAYLYGSENLSPPLTGIYSSVSSAVTWEAIPEKYRDRFLSIEQNAIAPVLTKESLEFILDNYKPDLQSPAAYPILSPDLTMMPKTYFQACGMDPLRDHTLVMEQVWKDAGISTKLDLYPGLSHGFWYMFPQLEASKRFPDDCKAGFRWLLS